MCKFYLALYALVPIKLWKNVLIRRHFEHCPSCANEYNAPVSELRAWLSPPWIEEAPGMWLEVGRALSSKASAEKRLPVRARPSLFARTWRPAAAAMACLAFGAAAVFLVMSGGRRTAGPRTTAGAALSQNEPRVNVMSAEVKGKPGKPYIYQTPKVVFIWIAPAQKTGG